MKLLFKLGWRNIWRNKRRSILTLSAVAFAALLAIGMRGIQLGTYDLNITTAVELFSGYLQIQDKEYQDSPNLRKSFRLNNDLKNTIESTQGVQAYSSRVYADGLISFKDNTFGGAIFGISPESEKQVTTFMENIDKGEFFNSDTSDKIIIGYKLLENLDASIGDTIVILAQGYDGALGNLKFEIAGTVKFGVQQLDMSAVFMGLKTAQDLLSMYGRINVVAIKTPGLDASYEVQKKLAANIRNEELRVLNWLEINPELQQQIELDNISGIMFLGILIVIVAFGILNTVLMSVTERFREFGVVLSIGMPQWNLVKLVYIETLIITIIGLIIGNILGWGVNLYILDNPIYLGDELAKLYEEYNFLPILKSSLNITIFINITLSILAISIVSCIYPAYKVYKLEPLKGIRYT